MTLKDLIQQLDTEVSEKENATNRLVNAKDALVAAQQELESATNSAGKEKQDVVDLLQQIIDEATIEKERLQQA